MRRLLKRVFRIGMFLPKAKEIKQDFRSLVDILELVSNSLRDDNRSERYKTIKILEEKADEIIHRISNKLAYDHTRVTEEKADIKELAERIDDIIDNLTEAVFLLTVVDVLKGNSISSLFSIVSEAIYYIRASVYLITTNDWREKEEDIIKYCAEINRLENLGDNHYRALFVEIEKRKYKEISELKELLLYLRIIDYLEAALDACEDVADIIDILRLKGGL